MSKFTSIHERGWSAVKNALPPRFVDTFKLRALGLTQIPMLLFVTPEVLENDSQKCVVRVPLNWRTKNHLGAMYFAALAAGADVSGGLIAWKAIEETDPKVKLIFKDFHADFLKRAEGDVHFTCTQGAEIRELVQKAAQTGERENLAVHITATVPKLSGDEPVARFILTLSLKKK